MTTAERCSEVIEQATSNIVNGVGCSTDTALRLLLVQVAIRVPDALRILQEHEDILLRQALEAPPPPVVN